MAAMRIYLVVADESKESRVALRFAARRAARTGGGVLVVALLPPAEFHQWGGVQAAIEEEAELRVHAMLARAAGALIEETGLAPEVVVRQGDPAQVVRAMLRERPGIAALVLGAAASGAPGPLVTHFAGAEAGRLPCPVMIVPGSLSDEALDRLS